MAQQAFCVNRVDTRVSNRHLPSPYIKRLRMPFGYLKWRWLWLAAIVAFAAALRSHHLSDVFLWIDETDFFNDKIFGNPPQPFLQYAIGTRDATTNTWGWPAILWVTCRLFGTTLKIARTPGMIAGSAMVLVMFFLIYRMLG